MSSPAVAVVGAGPVGALTALELARNGLPVVLLEARTQLAWTSRAICISRRSLEILDRAGVGAAFARKGLPWSKGRTFHRDKLVFRLELPHEPGDRHAPFINLQQCYTEQFLIDEIHGHGSIDLRWGHRVTAVEELAESVRATIKSSEGTYTLDVPWLVAADGARSAVRWSLGLAMKGTSYEGRYLISDIEVERAEWPIERHVWFDAPANPGSTVIVHVQPDSVWRIDMQLHEGTDPDTALLDENLIPRLQAQLDMMGVSSAWRLIWKSLYKAHSLSLDSYRHDRVLFAGDAAHLVPIFGVRGLNSGLDDAHNLAWKLAMVQKGQAGSTLLDSYSLERRRAAAENIANADKSTWFMSPPTNGFRRMRDAALMLAHDEQWARSLINPRQSSFHVYTDSPVVVADDRSDLGVRPGAPIPNLPLKRDAHLQGALASTGFSALVFEAFCNASQVDDILSACTSLGVQPLILDRYETAVADRFAAETFPLYLIRPDEHVAARFTGPELGAMPQAYAVAIGRGLAKPRSSEDCRVATPIEDIYETLSLALDTAQEAGDATSLERVALALANRIGDPQQVRELVDSALKCGRDEKTSNEP